MGMHTGWNGFGLVLGLLIVVVPLWKILGKAGFHGAWALLALVPVVNVVALWLFAFSEWPKARGGAQSPHSG